MCGKFLLNTLVLSAFFSHAFADTMKDKRPNVLFIMSDDHTSQAVGVYKSRLSDLNPTPTIDRIGNEGAIFTNVFCTNGISTPSRACIISGQYSQSNGVLDLEGSLAIEKQNLPYEMKKMGYQTAIVGKWHLGNNPEAFDYYNIHHGQGDYFNPVLLEKGDTAFVKSGKKLLRGKVYNGHSTDILTDIALDWFKTKRNKSVPFFFCMHYKAPHDMFEYHPRYKNYLKDVDIPEPHSLWDNKNNGSVATRGYDDSMMDSIGSSVGKRNVIRNMGIHMGISPELSSDEYKHEAYQEYLKRYLRCVKGVDDNVCRLFNYLEEEGLMDNTIIIYTGDQGFMLGEHDYIDKRWMYEEAMRMPFLVRYPPKIKAGTKVEAIVNNVDFAPTVINMCGGETPGYMQGDDFSEIIYNNGIEPEGWKQHTYYRYWMHMAHKHNNPAHFGIRTKRYKLIFFYGCDYSTKKKRDPMRNIQTPVAWELYDLKNDPYELNNIYNDIAYKDVVKRLKDCLKKERDRLNETDNNYPHIQRIIDEHWDD